MTLKVTKVRLNALFNKHNLKKNKGEHIDPVVVL